MSINHRTRPSARPGSRWLPFAGAILLVSFGARAEPPPRGSEAERQAAALAQEALGHVRRGEFEEALRLYADAYALAPTPAILFNRALTEMNAGETLKAIASLRLYLGSATRDEGTAALVTRELLPKALAATGHLDVRNAPRGSTFEVDGSPTIPADGVLDVAPGSHKLTTVSGQSRLDLSVSAPAGDISVVQFPSPAPPPRPPPPALGSEKSAVHAYTGGEPPSKAATNTRMVVALVLGGAAVAAAGSSFAFYELNQSAYSRYNTLHSQLGTDACSTQSLAASPQNSTPCAQLRSNLYNLNTYARASTGLLVTSGALAAGAVATYLLWPTGRAHTDGLHVVALIDPVGRSIAVQGVF